MKTNKPFGIIYKATCSVNGKTYVGQTVKQLSKRAAGHKTESNILRNNNHFHNSIRKHGYDNFTWEVLMECSSREELNLMETTMIKAHHSHASEGGYNSTWGGDGISGYKFTEEQKKHIRESHIGLGGWKWTQEAKEKHSIIQKNRIISPDELLKRKAPKTEKHKQNLRGKRPSVTGDKNPMYGKTHTDDVKQLLRDIKTGTKRQVDVVARIAEKNKKVSIIMFPDGHTEVIKGLKEFCKKNKLNTLIYHSKKNKFYKGFKIIKFPEKEIQT